MSLVPKTGSPKALSCCSEKVKNLAQVIIGVKRRGNHKVAGAEASTKQKQTSDWEQSLRSGNGTQEDFRS